jgi:hypothetical protein
MTKSLLSLGVGVNSTALAIVLVNDGWRGPIVFCDTGTEWPETYCYLEYFENEWLKPRGLEVTRLGSAYRALGPGRDMRSLIDYCTDYAVTPFAGTRWCTQGWKTDVLNQWAKEHDITTQLVGIAADEAHRQKGRACPLIERNITRQGCIEIIQTEGLEVPQKSGCYICPFQKLSQWRELWTRHPDLFERAARLEELSSARRGGQRTVLMAGGKTTLRELQYSFEHQTSLFDEVEMNEMLEYKPCICGV